ncbi:MAG: hypothetical protein ACTHOF_00640 [Flavisolibacter sp.]|jgi:hypothetical protein
MRLTILLFISFAILESCKKEGADKSDCQINNYGIYRLNFASAAVKHHVLVSVGFSPYEKDFDYGVLTDSMHIPAGTFSVNITSNNGGPAIDTEVTGVTITQCNETAKDVAF